MTIEFVITPPSLVRVNNIKVTKTPSIIDNETLPIHYQWYCLNYWITFEYNIYKSDQSQKIEKFDKTDQDYKKIIFVSFPFEWLSIYN